ncbi:MAG: hypothetical protein GY847_29330 [Proteobacteria bacterium]|nr:hypothetical protein [Pseudomonadota bacterium]
MLKFLGNIDNTPSGLAVFGPLVTVRLQPAPEVARAMDDAGIQPASVEATLMMDTGAFSTVIEEKTMQRLGMPPIRYMPIIGVSQKSDLCPVYRIAVEIEMRDENEKPGSATLVTNVAGVPSPSLSEKHVGLLGRDFLQYVRFVYDGPKGEFEIIDYLDKGSKQGR